MSEILYKIRHKPTGLFYKPDVKRDGSYDDNLVAKGKFYKVWPTIALDCILEHGVRHLAETHHFRPGQWEVVKFKLIELDSIEIDPEGEPHFGNEPTDDLHYGRK